LGAILRRRGYANGGFDVFAEDVESDFADVEGDAGGNAGVEFEVGAADEVDDDAGEEGGAGGVFGVFFDFAAPAFVATEFLAEDGEGAIPEGFWGVGCGKGLGVGELGEAVGEVAVVLGEDVEGGLGGGVAMEELLDGGEFGGAEGDHGRG
jgi:hypothetical protein